MASEALLQRWRITRSPALADALQRLASDDWFSKTKPLSGLIISEASERVPKLLSLDDPRLTVFLVDSLLAARWPSSSSQTLWEKIFARLVTLRDRRALEPLRAAIRTPPHFIGLAHTKWMLARLAETVSALERSCADLPRDDEKADALIASVQTELRPARRGGSFTVPKSKQVSGDSLQLVEAVWASPDDDAVRLVAADGLLEQNDPWGEFIALQFRIAQGKATAADTERAASLLHKHGVRFGGPIAAISTKDAWVFEKGFLVKCAADRSMVPRRRWDEALAAPHWATVRTLTLDAHTPQWFLKALLEKPTLASLRVVIAAFQRIERADAAGPWRLAKNKAKPGVLDKPLLRVFAKALGPANRASLEAEVSALA
jgi:uncharacterized protein (TIGR02996 family)